MPFITKTLHSSTPKSAIELLMDALNISRSDAQRFIVRGRLSQNGVINDDEFAVIEGNVDVICFIPEPRGLTPVYTSDDFAVFDKPSGLRVHPNNLETVYTLHDEIKHLFGHDANAAHRIDQETSGLVLVSRHKQSEPVLKELFSHRGITKRYFAMVHGCLNEAIDIQEPILRNRFPVQKINMVVKIDPAGKEARTFINPIRYFPDVNMTLVEATPLTGRSHQIRIHLFHVKHPIVGDPLYGQRIDAIHRYMNKELSKEERRKKSGAERLLLHAHSLEFRYKEHSYIIESQVDFIAECFKAMGKVIPDQSTPLM